MLRKLSIVAITIFLTGSEGNAVSLQLVATLGILIMSYMSHVRTRLYPHFPHLSCRITTAPALPPRARAVQ